MLCACGCKRVVPPPAFKWLRWKKYAAPDCSVRAKVRRYRLAHPDKVKAQAKRDYKKSKDRARKKSKKA
jgi:hypothetical protein